MKSLRTMCVRCAHALFGDYGLYKIYCRDTSSQDLPSLPTDIQMLRVEADDLTDSDDQAIKDVAGYAGQDSICFALHLKGQPASACAFWWGERYRRRNFWPLEQTEAKLVQINTAEVYQRRGLATMLIRAAVVEMRRRGFKRLYARVWYNNQSSVKAFEKAGWAKIALVLELFPFGKRKPFRCVWRYSG